MEYTTLGRTGLRVSVAGFGCGGSSRLGQATGASEAQSIALLHRAIDHGVNFFDTAAAYGTEAILGAAFRDVDRDSVVLSTKSQVARGWRRFSAARVVANLEQSLRHLKTDYVDIFHLHAVRPKAYDRVVDQIATCPRAHRARAPHVMRAACGVRSACCAPYGRRGCWWGVSAAFHGDRSPGSAP